MKYIGLLALFFILTSSAGAYEYTPPPELKNGQYYVQKNTDGSYTEYRGTPSGAPKQGLTFTSEAMDKNLEDLGKALEDGFDGGKNTGLPESMFNEVGGSKAGPYAAEDAGTAAVQEGFVSVARTDGYLPSLDEVASSAGGGGTAIDVLPEFVASLGAFAIGWEIGGVIDERWGIEKVGQSESVNESSSTFVSSKKIEAQYTNVKLENGELVLVAAPAEFREFCHSGGEVIPEGERWNESGEFYEQVKYGASSNNGYYPLVREGLCFIAWPQNADTFIECISPEARSGFLDTLPPVPEHAVPHGGCPYLETEKSREDEGYSNPKELNQTKNPTALGNNTSFQSCDWRGYGVLESAGFIFAKSFIKEETFEERYGCPGTSVYGALKELEMPKKTGTVTPGKFKSPSKPAPSMPTEHKKPVEIKVPPPLQVKIWPKSRSRNGPELPKPGEIEVPVPNKGETGEQYIQRLHDDGFPNTELNTLPETDIDPAVGPEEVAYSNPAQETFTPAATKVRVEQNPKDAPVPAEVPKKIESPEEPGIKLPSFGVLCKGFPFGVPCWLSEFVEGWSATPTAPEWGIDNFELLGHKIKGHKVKLSALEPIMEKVRPVMVIFATVGLLLLFYKFAKGGSPPSGGGTSDSGATEGYEGMEGM